MSTKFTTNIPNLIEKNLFEIAKFTQLIAENKMVLECGEAVLYEEVCQSKDENGRPLYTNDAARQNALIIAKAKNIGINEQIEMLQVYELKRAKIQAEIEALKMNFKLHLLDRELEIALTKN